MLLNENDIICLRKGIKITSKEIIDVRTGLIIPRNEFYNLQNQLIDYIYLNKKLKILINQFSFDQNFVKTEFYYLIKLLDDYNFIKVKTSKYVLFYKFILYLYHIDHYKIVVYHKNTTLMLLYLILSMLINLLPYCIVLNIIVNLVNNDIKLNFYILFYILNIFIHEIGHFIAYQILSNRAYQGYFIINIKKVSYVYMKLNDYRDKIIALAGPVSGFLLNVIIMLLDNRNINNIYIYIFIFLHLAMLLPWFDDGKLIFRRQHK